jgi:hypothetical protein
MWIDRMSVAVILLAASAYLTRRVVRRVASAFGRGASSGACGTDCGCGNDFDTDPQGAHRK